MSAAIAVRIRTEEEARLLEKKDGAMSSFILQVHDSMSPGLMKQLRAALETVDSETNLVAVEPIELIDSKAGTALPRARSRKHHTANQNALDRAATRGEAQLLAWTQDKTLIDGKRLQEIWGITRQGLDKARERGDIFSIRVGAQHFYPAEAAHFTRADLSEIVQALGEASPASKLMFLKRKHGALGGCTPAEAVEKGALHDVVRLAKAWMQT